MNKVILIFLIITFGGCYSKSPIVTGFEGQLMPGFTILLPDSTTYLNTATIKTGKPQVIFSFGPNCPYSRVQMEEIIEEIKILQGIQFYVITEWPFNEMKKFYNDFKLFKYSNITTGVDFNNYFLAYYKATGIPYLAIYGKDKRLHQAFLGKVNGNHIKEIAEH